MQRPRPSSPPRCSPPPRCPPHAAGEPEELLRVMRSFQSQVQELYSHTESLLGRIRTRHDTITHSNIMLDELEARINDMVISSSNLDQRWNDVLDINQVASVLDDMEALFDEMEEQLIRSREGR